MLQKRGEFQIVLKQACKCTCLVEEVTLGLWRHTIFKKKSEFNFLYFILEWSGCQLPLAKLPYGFNCSYQPWRIENLHRDAI
jgi:hypothetical protein